MPFSSFPELSPINSTYLSFLKPQSLSPEFSVSAVLLAHGQDSSTHLDCFISLWITVLCLKTVVSHILSDFLNVGVKATNLMLINLPWKKQKPSKSSIIFQCLIYFLSFAVLGIEPRASPMLGRHSTTEPYPQYPKCVYVCVCLFITGHWTQGCCILSYIHSPFYLFIYFYFVSGSC